MNKRVLIGIVLFFVASVGIYSFASTSGSNKEKLDSNQKDEEVEVDSTAPIFTLNGDITEYINVKDSFDVMNGVTATDDKDGDVTDKIIVGGTVDTNTIGSYDLTYDVQDETGNKAETLKRRVVVSDEKAPVIKLIGANEINLEVKGTYTEEGATVTDNYNNNLNVIISGIVDTNTLGTYTITYNATDNSGNKAVELTRKVNVVDTTKPVINLANTDLNMEIEVENDNPTPYVEEYGTITDNYDTVKNITNSNIKYEVKKLDSTYETVTSIDTSIVAEYRVTYSAIDSNNNKAIDIIRYISVVDTTDPICSIVKTPNIEWTNDHYTLTVNASDNNEDGGLLYAFNTGEGTSFEDWTTSNTKDYYNAGTRTITVKVKDASGEIGTCSVEIKIDKTRPTITSNTPSSVQVGIPYTHTQMISFANISDADSGINQSTITYGGVNTGYTFTTLGSKTITYYAKDNAGNERSRNITFNVVDTTKPVINLANTDLNMEIEVENDNPTPYVEEYGTITDNYDTVKNITNSNIKYEVKKLDSTYETVTSIDTSIVAEYRVTYSAIDSNNNKAIDIIRYISVVDTTDPICSIVKTPNIEWTNDHYTLTVNASDNNEDGGLLYAFNTGEGTSFEDWTTSNTKDYYNAGTRTITVKVKDASGEIGTCSVEIKIDKTRPTITSNTPSSVQVGIPYTHTQMISFANISDADSGINQSTITYGGVNTGYTFTTLGSKTITYYVKDNAGNERSVNITFNVVDTIPPTITSNAPTSVEIGIHYTNAQMISFANISDSGTGVNLSTITYDGINTGYTFTTLGSKTITYYAKDNAGNATTGSITFNVVDTTPPTCSITKTWNYNHYTLTVTASDNNPNTTLQYRFDNGYGVFGNWSTINSADYYNSGTRTITVEVRDSAGKVGTCSTQIVIR